MMRIQFFFSHEDKFTNYFITNFISHKSRYDTSGWDVPPCILVNSDRLQRPNSQVLTLLFALRREDGQYAAAGYRSLFTMRVLRFS